MEAKTSPNTQSRFHIEIAKNRSDIAEFDPLASPIPKKSHGRHRSIEVTVDLADDIASLRRHSLVQQSPNRSASLDFSSILNEDQVTNSSTKSQSQIKISDAIKEQVIKQGRFTLTKRPSHEEDLGEDIISSPVKPVIIVRRVSADNEINHDSFQHRTSFDVSVSDNDDINEDIPGQDTPTSVDDLIIL